MHLAASPAWFADGIVPVTIVALLVIAALVVRLVQQVALRVTLVALLAVMALVIYVNRAPLEVCARTCECQLAGNDVTVPLCEPDIHL